jgi:Cu+-exporting ATPase
VLIRHAEALETLERVTTLVVDKTGTLTEGKPTLSGVEAIGGFDRLEVLRLVASLEHASEHPLAAAIVTGAATANLALAPVSHFDSITGQGVRGTIEGREIVVGNRALIAELGIDPAATDAAAERRRTQGETVMLVAIDRRAAGLIGVTDPIKTTAAEAVRALRGEGLQIVMLTGDHRTTAAAVAATLGISRVEAEVLPDHKAAVVAALQARGEIVAMAGDGINDAPALARANVGIAMGTGTAVAIESAGMTLVRGDLRGIVRARRLSRATMKNIRQNLFFAFIYNIVGVPVAAGILYPFFGLLLSPMIASAAMTFSSVSVITNALRLRRAAL